MRHCVVGIWDATEDLYIEASPVVRFSNGWHDCQPYVYDEGEWKMIGGAGTLMIPFITSDGKYFYTSDGKMFLVRTHA